MRQKEIAKLLKSNGIDGLLLSAFSNSFYITGLSMFSKYEQEIFVLLTKNHIFLFTDPRYENALKHLQNIEVVIRNRENPFSDQLYDIVRHERIGRLGFEDSLQFGVYNTLKKHLKNIKLVPTVEVIEKIRSVKSLYEIKKIKEASKISDNAFSFALNFLKPGVTEKEIVLKIEDYMRQNGATPAFASIVAFGKNAAVPHHQSGDSKLKMSDGFILFDIGAEFENYASDLSRTVFIGKPDERMKKIYDTVLASQLMVINKMSGADIKIPDLDKACEVVLKKNGFTSVPHALGHGVGIDVHELPVVYKENKQKLAGNTVLTVEPGIYIEGFGGVRIEDTVWYDGKSTHTLTKSPKNLIEI